MRMVSRQQKVFYLLTAAGLLWLGYAKSAEGARRGLKKAGRKASNALSSLQDRTQEVGRLVHGIADVGTVQKDHMEQVLHAAMYRLEQTIGVIQENFAETSRDISGMIRELRTALRKSVSAPSQAA